MSNPHPFDQIRYCERCGISFLWSAEEQKETQKSASPKPPASQPPSHCPGCRLLLPAAGRERGLVKWYNHRKRYGFLVRRDHPEIFAHGSDIQGANSLRPGDLVEFTVETGERGPAAKEIAIIDHTDPPILD
ncbi:MAG: cold shock domain-containing protein [Caldilineaceae bacterium]|nr:cold shock domain-containing protein [Caldilineaceae bacterium]